MEKCRVTLEWLRGRAAGAKGLQSSDRTDHLAGSNGGDVARLEEANITGIRSEGGNVTYILQHESARSLHSTPTGVETAAQVRLLYECFSKAASTQPADLV